MIVWKEQEPEAELSVKHLKLSIAHYFLKSLLHPFLVWAKTSSFNISHFSRSFKGAGGSADFKISKSALLSLNHHNFLNAKPIYTE